MLNGWLSPAVSAAPEEIQVYLDDFAEVGKPGLDLHTNYLTADFSLGSWEFNLGIGHVSGQTPDRTVLKAIIGVPLQ